ncbi:MAG: terminase TerL endonuclease subunit, partial [Spirochaetota bacterium]|nr:terminase TerL endonuclease subunit [Spirochaetota bacterium]
APDFKFSGTDIISVGVQDQREPIISQRNKPQLSGIIRGGCLTAFILVFPPIKDEKDYIVLSYFYVPEDTIIERSRQDKVHYDLWAKEGYIKATPGNVIDYDFIRNDILAASKKYNMQEIGYDPWGATELATKLYNEYKIRMVEIRQWKSNISEPAKDILVKVKKGEIDHYGNPVLRWCTDNLVMIPDADEHVRPAKDKATDRIDGFVALINAWTRMMFREETSSIYNKKDLLVL